jgi:hypothetical protein
MARIANKFRAILSLMCLGLPSTDDKSETEDNEFQVRERIMTKSATTHSYPRNTLMGLPTELRLIIYKFALQDIVDTIVCDRGCKCLFIRYDSARRLGGMALPLTSRTMRKESVDVYGPLVKQHRDNQRQRYIDLRDEAIRLPAVERRGHVRAGADAYLRWRAVQCLQRVVNGMYINECYVRGYYGELHAEARMAEWRARVGGVEGV